jgi:hypothetical protein
VLATLAFCCPSGVYRWEERRGAPANEDCPKSIIRLFLVRAKDGDRTTPGPRMGTHENRARARNAKFLIVKSTLNTLPIQLQHPLQLRRRHPFGTRPLLAPVIQPVVTVLRGRDL